MNSIVQLVLQLKYLKPCIPFLLICLFCNLHNSHAHTPNPKNTNFTYTSKHTYIFIITYKLHLDIPIYDIYVQNNNISIHKIFLKYIGTSTYNNTISPRLTRRSQKLYLVMPYHCTNG